MVQKPEDDKMLRKDPEVDLDKLSKAELVQRLKENPDAARARDLEASNAALQAELAKQTDKALQGSQLMDQADLGVVPEYEMEVVQFHSDYSYGGKFTPNPRVIAHRAFSVRGGEVVYMPKKLVTEISRSHRDKMNIGKKELKDQKIGGFEFDAKTGQRKAVQRTIPVEELLSKAREVGLAVVK